MDSKQVAKARRQELGPTLSEAGFGSFDGYRACRHLPEVVHVFRASALSTHVAEVIGTTTMSFGIDVGVCYRAPYGMLWSQAEPPRRPDVYQCHANRALTKSIFQLWLRRPDIWHVKRSGRNLAKVVRDAHKAVREQALPWLDRFTDPAFALDAFESRPETWLAKGIAVEQLGGQLASLARARIASALALSLGHTLRAVSAWQAVLDNPFYRNDQRALEEARRNVAWIEDNAQATLLPPNPGVEADQNG